MQEKFIYYNANTHSVSSEDCVKRSISLAFDIDYEVVAKLLRRKAKDYRLPWNVKPVFTSVIKDLNGGDIETIASTATVSEFAEIHTSGTYLILCNDKRNWHLVCIIDGNIYDSWDSSNMKCVDVYMVSNDASTTYNYDTQKSTLKDYAETLIKDFINGQNFKYGNLSIEDDSDFYTSDYAFSFTVTYSLKDIGYPSRRDLIEPIEFTFSPRRTLEQNTQIIYKLCKTTCARLVKAVKNYIAEYESDDTYEDKFDFDSAGVYSKLPLWAQKLLICAYRGFSWAQHDRVYKVQFQPLNADSNKEPFYIEAKTITELKKILEHYRKTLERQDN